MNSWIFLAILGHLANAVAFIIDKVLLTTTLKRSATYAVLISTLSLVVIVAAPWVQHWPNHSLYLPIMGYGGLFVLGLWAFFEALKRSEASRVVPIVGSFVPIFTLLEAVLFLQEKFTAQQLFGFFVLLIATWLLTRKNKSSVQRSKHSMTLLILAALLFATASVLGKYAFAHGEFLGVFVSSRVVAGIVGIVLGLLISGVKQELFSLIRGGKSNQRTPIWAIIGQLFGALGFILISIAIAQGSAPMVNVLQAVQYGAIVLVAWFGSKRLRELLNEEKNRHIILTKTLAIILIALGLMLITL